MVWRPRGPSDGPTNVRSGRTLAARLEHYSIPEPTSGCLLWTGSMTNFGYGVLWWRGKLHGAHRLSYFDTHGDIPAGMHVLHRCDNPACIAPAHLRLGSNEDNIADRIAKRRSRYVTGEGHSKAKLSAEQVATIRRDKRATKIVAPEFGISVRHVNAIRSGEYWRQRPPLGITA